MTAPVLWAVSGLDVTLAVLRAGLPVDRFGTRRPDDLPAAMRYAMVRRTGGSSLRPRFWDRCFINVQHWAAPDHSTGIDASRAAELFADDVRRVLWTAHAAQTVTGAGHIARIRESEGPEDTPDPDLPHYGRYITTYELLIRRLRTP